MIKLGVISLGCAKNRVDTEVMLGMLKNDCEFVSDPSKADVILINTCGFIESAKQEAIDTILEMAQYKISGHLKGLVVTGCLSERYRDELMEALPEIDVMLGVHAASDIKKAVLDVFSGKQYMCFSDNYEQDFNGRLLTTPPYSAYVRISDGCSNRCSYCAIPMIRGGFKSRTIESICEEAELLAKRGVKEISLIAQDTTKYGIDLYGKPMLSELIKKVAPIQGIEWLRVLYCYPESITEELIDTMLSFENVVKYIDIPIQHLDDDVLKNMNRKNTCKSTYKTINLIRSKSSDFIIRTTVITGFPGESEQAFETLKNGVRELEFDRLGAFAFSCEEGTPAADMEQLSDGIGESRRDEIMQIQMDISCRLNKKRIGKNYKWLAEGFDAESGMYFGRTYAEAPEADGRVFVKAEQLDLGEFYNIVVTGSFEYDLEGELLNECT